MPKREWGSPEHYVLCPGCGERMHWWGTTVEDTTVIGFLSSHTCGDCGERAEMLLDNDRSRIEVYTLAIVDNLEDLYQGFQHLGGWRP